MPGCSCSRVRSSSTWALYGVMIPMSSARTPVSSSSMMCSRTSSASPGLDRDNSSESGPPPVTSSYPQPVRARVCVCVQHIRVCACVPYVWSRLWLRSSNSSDNVRKMVAPLIAKNNYTHSMRRRTKRCLCPTPGCANRPAVSMKTTGAMASAPGVTCSRSDSVWSFTTSAAMSRPS